MTKNLLPFLKLVGLGTIPMLLWTLTVAADEESAAYTVIKSDGVFEIREYPDLMLAATNSSPDATGRDGGFMRLFRYISGNNEAEQKISMTTPVFMRGDAERKSGSMGFVMPRQVAANGVPAPRGDNVKIETRSGGKFAVIRFPGQMDASLAKANEAKLRDWMRSEKLEGQSSFETAGYDPPWTPAPMRRNEVLIRIK